LESWEVLVSNDGEFFRKYEVDYLHFSNAQVPYLDFIQEHLSTSQKLEKIEFDWGSESKSGLLEFEQGVAIEGLQHGEVVFQDYDNDGLTDVYSVKTIYHSATSTKWYLDVLQNLGRSFQPKFLDVLLPQISAGYLNSTFKKMSKPNISIMDYDGDGAADLFTSGFGIGYAGKHSNGHMISPSYSNFYGVYDINGGIATLKQQGFYDQISSNLRAEFSVGYTGGWKQSVYEQQEYSGRKAAISIDVNGDGKKEKIIYRTSEASDGLDTYTLFDTDDFGDIVYVFDLNSDGLDDAIVLRGTFTDVYINKGGEFVRQLENYYLGILGKAQAGGQPLQDMPDDSDIGINKDYYLVPFNFIDVNADGMKDFVYIDKASSEVTVRLANFTDGNSVVGFATAQKLFDQVDTDFFNASILAMDLDSDEQLDIVILFTLFQVCMQHTF